MPPTQPPPTSQQLAGAVRELRRRPRPVLADLDPLGRLPSPTERAARRVEDLYPAVAAAVLRPVLTAGAQPPLPGCCRWRLALLAARVHGHRLRLSDPTTRAILGRPCLACRAALDPKPTPTPKRPAQPAALSRAERAEREARGLRRVVDAALAELAAATTATTAAGGRR